jgi:hypothetical protein
MFEQLKYCAPICRTCAANIGISATATQVADNDAPPLETGTSTCFHKRGRKAVVFRSNEQNTSSVAARATVDLLVCAVHM